MIDPRPAYLRHLPLISATPLADAGKAGAAAAAATHRGQQSELEDLFARALNPWVAIPPPVREWRFAPPRRWRFDFAWPQHMVAVEIDGLVWHNRGVGRHQTVDGILGDCEKYEAAIMGGWTVYRIPGPWIRDEERLHGVVLPNLAELIDRADYPIRLSGRMYGDGPPLDFEDE